MLLFAQSFLMLTVAYFTESVLLVWATCVGLIVVMHTEKAFDMVVCTVHFVIFFYAKQ